MILFNVDGCRLPFPNAVEENISPLCSMPILRYTEDVVISHIDKEKVYIQRVLDETYITDLGNQLVAFYDNQEEEKVPLETDKFYVAKSAQFGTWYR